ncbi:class F sortase [Candidatus Kaiserbacteria bacterium]|nr:class F sortase [Candidatus Kaiserbacteria bacterium]
MLKSCALASIPLITVCTAVIVLNLLFSVANASLRALAAEFPLLPNTSGKNLNSNTLQEIKTLVEKRDQNYFDYPTRIEIPSIGLDAPIVPVGVNAKREIDVPPGNSNYVGWYKHGSAPGEIGSAVMDAHVYAAFKDLKNVAPGADIYVTTASGKKMHFLVFDRSEYPLAGMNISSLIRETDTSDLNLITCAGTYIRSRGTYDHRLVVYTRLVGIE